MPDNSADFDQFSYDGPLGVLYAKEKTLFNCGLQLLVRSTWLSLKDTMDLSGKKSR